ncbi:MAG: sensor histidine kinase [Chloroflexota bacterium]
MNSEPKTEIPGPREADARPASSRSARFTNRDLQKRAVEAQEAERSRLAREIHDGPAQVLSNAVFQLEIIERQLDRDPVLALAEIRLLRDTLRRELGEMRAYISQLRPPILADLGLAGAIRDIADQVGGILGINIAVDVDPAIDDMSDGSELVVLRIIQEALQNVRRHAEAQRVTIRAVPDDTLWLVEVHDNGRGFDPDAKPNSSRPAYGLQFMRERAESIDAQFEVRSQPGGGTTVRLAVPRGEEETT